jgi:hypothetical protein
MNTTGRASPIRCPGGTARAYPTVVPSTLDLNVPLVMVGAVVVEVDGR